MWHSFNASGSVTARGDWQTFSPERRERILELLRAGNYREPACTAAGVPRRTFYNWLVRGATGEEPYATFAREVAAAESAAEISALGNVRSAAEKDWKADAWYLGRKHPERWAERPAPPPETKTAEVAAAEGEPATPQDSRAMKQPSAEAEENE
jgi:transposase